MQYQNHKIVIRLIPTSNMQNLINLFIHSLIKLVYYNLTLLKTIFFEMSIFQDCLDLKIFYCTKSFLETILPLYLKASEMKKLLDSCNFLILGSSCSLPNSYHRQLSFLSSIRSNLNAKYYDYSVYMRCWQPFKEFLKTFVSCREFASSPRTKFLKKYILGLTKVCINVMLA